MHASQFKQLVSKFDILILHAAGVPTHAVVAEFIGTLLFQFIGGGAAANAVSTGLATAAIGV